MLTTIGRILFALLFIFSGLSKFFDLGATAQIIEAKVTIPGMAAPYATQIETALGITAFRLLAMIAAGVEVLGGLMIAFNLAARLFAFILAVFVVIVTVYVHDFWNQGGGGERLENIIHVMKNMAIVGTLLMIMGQRNLPAERSDAAYHNRVEL